MAEIRKFDDFGIQSSIDKALETLPPGQKGAVVAYVDGDSTKLAVVGRLGDQWSVVGTLDRKWDGHLTGGASVRFTW